MSINNTLSLLQQINNLTNTYINFRILEFGIDLFFLLETEMFLNYAFRIRYVFLIYPFYWIFQ